MTEHTKHKEDNSTNEDIKDKQQQSDIKHKNMKSGNNRERDKKIENKCKEEEYKEKYLRLHAEFDNYRKQMEKDKQQARIKGAMDVIGEFITILDDLEQAEKHSDESKNQMDPGLKLIIKKINSIFEKLDVREINLEGKKYDPNVCEVVGVEKADEDKKEGHIAKIVRKGYMYKEYLIRPAMVIVYK